MTGASKRPGNFFKAISFVQLHRLVHGVERFQITIPERQHAGSLQALCKHTLAPALATTAR